MCPNKLLTYAWIFKILLLFKSLSQSNSHLVVLDTSKDVTPNWSISNYAIYGDSISELTDTDIGLGCLNPESAPDTDSSGFWTTCQYHKLSIGFTLNNSQVSPVSITITSYLEGTQYLDITAYNGNVGHTIERIKNQNWSSWTASINLNFNWTSDSRILIETNFVSDKADYIDLIMIEFSDPPSTTTEPSTITIQPSTTSVVTTVTSVEPETSTNSVDPVTTTISTQPETSTISTQMNTATLPSEPETSKTSIQAETSTTAAPTTETQTASSTTTRFPTWPVPGNQTTSTISPLQPSNTGISSSWLKFIIYFLSAIIGFLLLTLVAIIYLNFRTILASRNISNYRTDPRFPTEVANYVYTPSIPRVYWRSNNKF